MVLAVSSTFHLLGELSLAPGVGCRNLLSFHALLLSSLGMCFSGCLNLSIAR